MIPAGLGYGSDMPGYTPDTCSQSQDSVADDTKPLKTVMCCSAHIGNSGASSLSQVNEYHSDGTGPKGYLIRD